VVQRFFMDAKKNYILLLMVAGAMFAVPLFNANQHADVADIDAAQAALPPVAVPVVQTVVPVKPASVAVKAVARTARKAVDDREPTQPLDAMRITSPYGERMHPILHRVENHPGVDLGASLNDPIHAVYDGVVTRAGWRGGYGNAVEIYHPKLHESTLYGHMNALEVKTGQRVAEGQVIGLAGTTGLSTGVHLHFGVLKNGGWTNPIAFLDGLSDAPASTAIATTPAAPRSYKPTRKAKSIHSVQIAAKVERAARRPEKTEVAVAPPKAKPVVNTAALQDRYTAAAQAAATWSQLYETGAVSRNDRDAKVAEANSLQAQLKAAKAG
jgi:hypothetical protein